jgi:hypothetical protein
MNAKDHFWIRDSLRESIWNILKRLCKIAFFIPGLLLQKADAEIGGLERVRTVAFQTGALD